MGSDWGNLRNKAVKINLSSIADEHLEKVLDKNFTSAKQFKECVDWYRKLIYYLNEVAGLNGDITPSNNDNLLQMSMGSLGFLTFHLYRDIEKGLMAIIEDFNFNPYKSLVIEKRKTIDGIITEVLAEYISRKESIIA